MRGTLVERDDFWCRGGIIPAYAGNTSRRPVVLRSWRDHPRVCGEHNSMNLPCTASPGSSPRMRGTLRVGDTVRIASGIIPAYAGNTFHGPTMNCDRRDHPRVCGEHLLLKQMVSFSKGSSPRMRGTRQTSPVRARRIRIIPAYAGNTYCCMSGRCPQWDHPRVCGEHTYHVDAPEAIAGSSPRMRGTRPEPLLTSSSSGIIPAYAGNTRA